MIVRRHQQVFDHQVLALIKLSRACDLCHTTTTSPGSAWIFKSMDNWLAKATIRCRSREPGRWSNPIPKTIVLEKRLNPSPNHLFLKICKAFLSAFASRSGYHFVTAPKNKHGGLRRCFRFFLIKLKTRHVSDINSLGVSLAFCPEMATFEEFEVCNFFRQKAFQEYKVESFDSFVLSVLNHFSRK